MYPHNLPGFFSAQLRQGVSFRFAQCIMDESCPAALVLQHIVIQRLRTRNTHIIIMAEENGVCHVNGEPEVVDGDLQNGEPDDDDKGYDI